MNICDSYKPAAPINSFKRGNLYRYTEVEGADVCIAIDNNTLVFLVDGLSFKVSNTYEKYQDVTDSYCLQKVK